MDSFGRHRRRLGTAALLPLCALLMWGCNSAAGSAAPVASTSALPAATPSALPSQAAGPTPTRTPLPSSSSRSSCLQVPHEAPEVEQLLPAKIAGKPLTTWSYHGENWLTCLGTGTAADIAAFDAELAAQGLSLKDISVATGGRSDTASDPPYLIHAYMMAGQPGSYWPPTFAVDHPDAAGFRETVIEGKTVLVGDTAAVEQTEHQRGRPYIWNSPTVHYVIITDDEAWAAEALRSLN